jgi:hypothetical protein
VGNEPHDRLVGSSTEYQMLKQFILGGVALAIVGGVAFAETNATAPAQPDAQVADNAGNPPPPPAADPQGGDGQGWWGWGRHGHGGHRHGDFGPGQMAMNGAMGGPGGPSMMGGPGMMMDHQGFRMTLGHGINVGVMCGKQALKDCIADAQPLIDAAKAAATAQAPAAKTP